MEIIKYIVIILECLLSVALIVAVLVQSGKEDGLSGALAGKTETFMSKNDLGSWDKKLASWTKWIAAGWIFLTLLISIL